MAGMARGLVRGCHRGAQGVRGGGVFRGRGGGVGAGGRGGGGARVGAGESGMLLPCGTYECIKLTLKQAGYEVSSAHDP